MNEEQSERKGSTNGPTEPNQRPPERREDPAKEAVKGPAVISEGNAKQRADSQKRQR